MASKWRRAAGEGEVMKAIMAAYQSNGAGMAAGVKNRKRENGINESNGYARNQRSERRKSDQRAAAAKK